MAGNTRKFEDAFAKKIGSKYALMVNSGSSANLLAAFAAGNLSLCVRPPGPGTVHHWRKVDGRTRRIDARCRKGE